MTKRKAGPKAAKTGKTAPGPAGAPRQAAALVDTRIIYCGDCLEQLQELPDGCVELSRVLKKAGSFYYHCDWHASHYVKVMLDQIFGQYYAERGRPGLTPSTPQTNPRLAKTAFFNGLLKAHNQRHHTGSQPE